jgi:hypothetical protein
MPYTRRKQIVVPQEVKEKLFELKEVYHISWRELIESMIEDCEAYADLMERYPQLNKG